MTNADRAAVVAEARSWLGTPWHHRARIKGAGVDCVQLLAGVFHACGLLPDIDTGDYPPDWMFHRDEERMLNGLRQYAAEIDSPAPGDVVVFRFGRCYSHCGIIVDAPVMIHAYIDERAVVIGDLDAGAFAGRARKFFTIRSDQ